MPGFDETNRQNSSNRANLALETFVEKLLEFNSLQANISESYGSVTAHIDELMQHVDGRMEHIKRARAGIRQKQKHQRKLARQLAELLPQIRADR
jgi:predicted transcriptional regulator